MVSMIVTTLFLALCVLGLLTAVGLVLLGKRRVRTVYASQLTEEPTIRHLIALGLLGSVGQLNLVARISAKTADYTILPYTVDSSGTIFTNRGAGGAVIFTLPAPVPLLAGYRYIFKVHANQNVTVATATADTLIALNDVAADSVAASTTNEKIGAQLEAICDGTSWFVSGIAVGHTYTIAT